MATYRANEVVHHVCRAMLRQDGAELADGELLGRYIDQRDETAFAMLVRRHGPMVWGVCRRLLSHQDAEDAFQAAFLVLCRKAASVQPRERVANWLYGVARQAALQARRTVARRAARETQVADLANAVVSNPDRRDDLRPLLDQELSRLPDRYRAVAILCDLEGKTRKEVARQLHLPEGTVASQLARARAILAKRLTRRGIVLTTTALTAVLCREAGLACVPPSVVSCTIRSVSVVARGPAAAAGAIPARVAALREGVLKAMLVNRIRRAMVLVFLTVLLGLTGGMLVWEGKASEPLAQAAGKEEDRKDDDLRKTLIDLDELWWKGDVEILRKLAADDLITVSQTGRYDKASLLAAAKNRHSVDWVRRDVEVSRISTDVAIVTYVYDCKVVLRNGALVQKCRDRRLSLTWANRKNGWVVVFAQETVLPGGE